MKIKPYLLSIFVMIPAHAVTFDIIGKNKEVLLHTQKEVDLTKSLGQISLDLFNEHHVPYQGGDSGFSSIFELGQDIDLISDYEMKAYGWCFSINTKVPETLADKTHISAQNSKIEWFYSYAYYNKAWISYCTHL